MQTLVCAGLGVAVVPESMETLTRPGVEYRFLSKTMPAIQNGRGLASACWISSGIWYIDP